MTANSVSASDQQSDVIALPRTNIDSKTIEKSTYSVSIRGKRIGILIVAYNAVTTLTKVLNRIPEDVWANVEEVVVFDDASKDATYEVGVGYKAVAGLDKLHIMKNDKNLGYGGNQKLG